MGLQEFRDLLDAMAAQGIVWLEEELGIQKSLQGRFMQEVDNTILEFLDLYLHGNTNEPVGGRVGVSSGGTSSPCLV